MCALDQIDSCAQLFDDMANDPGFYTAKAFLREIYPDAPLIEIVPAQELLANVTIVHSNGAITKVMI
ncbi:hypothetical protein IWQ49_000042 [Labrenzia sp. EL_126]|nr:hypothetical protein [Labrenzia sp. EL_126]